MSKGTSRVAIVIQFNFEGIHSFPGAKPEVGYLRNAHRHLFYVRIECSVLHTNREIEFIEARRHMLDKFRGGELGTRSCEDLACEIAQEFCDRYGPRNIRVEVLEDGQNGAIFESQVSAEDSR